MSAQISRNTLRHAVSAILPDAARRRIDAVRNWYAVTIVSPANREFVRRHGLNVTGGPFAGMQYLPGQEHTQGDLVSKLLGIYEVELHEAVDSWRGSGLSLVVNVGCAEGYYAVGLANAMPSVEVLAYDIDPRARQLCGELAALNGVSERVQVRGECTPQTLATLPRSGVGLFCDCEGYELTLLDPEIAPNLREWSIIAELHDFVDATITDTICRRFDPTHEIDLITSITPAAAPPEVDFMSQRQRNAVLSERPAAMNWVKLSPRSQQ